MLACMISIVGKVINESTGNRRELYDLMRIRTKGAITLPNRMHHEGRPIPSNEIPSKLAEIFLRNFSSCLPITMDEVDEIYITSYNAERNENWDVVTYTTSIEVLNILRAFSARKYHEPNNTRRLHLYLCG